MKIIALDQSSTATGISMFVDGKLVKYCLIKPKVSKKVDSLVREYDKNTHIYALKMPEEMYGITLLRITAITDLLENIFRNERPDVVYFEDIFENRNPKGFKSLARLQGFIAHICHSLNIRYEIVEESKWISSWGTYSQKTKREMRKADIMQKVNDLYGLDITIDDLSDSIGIGKYAIENENEK